MKVLLFFTMFLIADFAFAQQASFATSHKIKLIGCDGDCEVVVLRKPNEIMAEKNWRWGADSQNPSLRLESFSVKFLGQEVQIPLSAFIDLGDPKKIELRGRKDSLAVHIYGGETSTFYEAILYFYLGRLTNKKVCATEFPTESCEKTEYSFIAN